MSVRRLAEPAVQPASFAFNRANTASAKNWIKKYPKGREQSAVIPLLMIAQEQEGWVTKAAIEHVSQMLEMPLIRVLEVATFYTQFQLKPVGTRAHVQVCGTTPCALRGAGALMEVCRSKIHPEQFHPNADGTMSWEEVECLGACVNAPMIMVFKDTYEDLTPERLSEIIDAFEAGKGATVPVGPQNGREVSAPITGLTSLKDEQAVLASVADWRKKRASADATVMNVAPANGAKPRTSAEETSNSVKSPAPARKEKPSDIDSVAPGFSGKRANLAAPAVEKVVGKQRKGPLADRTPNEPAPYTSPELIKGEPIGAGRKKLPSERGKAEEAVPLLNDANRPVAIEKPAVVDDLKLISGVGPKLEATLHGLGIYTFAQVASWKQPEREWVDGYLRFHGRIERDNWVKQAAALAKGGVDEYFRVFGKKPV
ncbi:NADH-quinone oxidoreductase subunit E [Mesorhizobium sp. NBSH29]|uniref:NADH-quinone oxidoreductase subunit E n=1 Tax=Mesorhizobium sp. NBSH29 TaxID=2654249 RepID=UPI00189673C4|nr:NADH-quinone oxidoreductase subunit E [Mesorhizobium sp. NBSH29]QPC87467.1 NADH-quinone oxidoreductase subunit E [Mesorhizobium sp. NBSH29]